MEAIRRKSPAWVIMESAGADARHFALRVDEILRLASNCARPRLPGRVTSSGAVDRAVWIDPSGRHFHIFGDMRACWLDKDLFSVRAAGGDGAWFTRARRVRIASKTPTGRVFSLSVRDTAPATP